MDNGCASWRTVQSLSAANLHMQAHPWVKLQESGPAPEPRSKHLTRRFWCTWALNHALRKTEGALRASPWKGSNAQQCQSEELFAIWRLTIDASVEICKKLPSDKIRCGSPRWCLSQWSSSRWRTQSLAHLSASVAPESLQYFQSSHLLSFSEWPLLRPSLCAQERVSSGSQTASLDPAFTHTV